MFSIAISVRLEAILNSLHIHLMEYPSGIGAKFWDQRDDFGGVSNFPTVASLQVFANTFEDRIRHGSGELQ
jgi:hypothetical protein